MSVLYGLTTPDEGEILVRGEPVRFRSAHDAIEAGLGMVHQAFRLFPTMTVAENVVYGHEPRTGWFLDRAAAKRAVNELATGYGLSVDPSARIEDLRVGALQRVEILKALYRDARVLILDEPTAVLTPQERDSLFEVLRHLRADGRTILFITHKLNEVMTLSDRVTVLRRGRVVHEALTSETSPAELSLAMTGRAVDTTTRRRPDHEVGAILLEVDDVCVDDADGVRRVDHVRFHVRRGRSSASPASRGAVSRTSSRRSSGCAAPRRARSPCAGSTSRLSMCEGVATPASPTSRKIATASGRRVEPRPVRTS